MMISSSPLVPTSAVGATPAAATTPVPAVTAFTLTLQSMAPGGESALAAPLLAAGFPADAAVPQELSLAMAIPSSKAAILAAPLPAPALSTIAVAAEPDAPTLAAADSAQVQGADQIAPFAAAPAPVTVEAPDRTTPLTVAIPDPETIAKPAIQTEASPITNAIAYSVASPLLAERAPAQKVEPAVEAGRAKTKAIEPGKAPRSVQVPAVPSNGEAPVIAQAEPAIVSAGVTAAPAPDEIELPAELAALDPEMLPVEGPIAPSAPPPAQPVTQPQVTPGDDKAAAPDIAPSSPRLAAASAVAESSPFASPAPVAATAAPADAAVFSMALDGQLPQAANDTQGLPSPLFGQTLAPATSRPLSAQHIYPTQPAPLPGTVTAQPGRIGREMGVEIARRVSGGQDEMLIRLNPQEMGRIEVRLTFDESGAVRAVLASESPAALEMLRRDTGDLARSLADAGVRSDSQSFRFDRSGGDGAGQRGHGGGNAQHDRQASGPAFQGGADEEPDASVYRQLRSSGQVNLIA